MSYLQTISPSDATYPMHDFYKSVLDKMGDIPNHAHAFSLLPDGYMARAPIPVFRGLVLPGSVVERVPPGV
jgi:hypothetical protein